MVNVRVEMYPVAKDMQEVQVGQLVLLIGLKNINWQGASPVDPDGNWGGPYTRGNNTPLRDLMRSGGICVANGVDAGNVTGYDQWRVVLSSARLGCDPCSDAQLAQRLRVQLYLTAPALFPGNVHRGDLIVFSGIWDDQAFGAPNGTPDAGGWSAPAWWPPPSPTGSNRAR